MGFINTTIKIKVKATRSGAPRDPPLGTPAEQEKQEGTTDTHKPNKHTLKTMKRINHHTQV